MTTKTTSSKDSRARVVRSCLVRVVLPFSYSRHLDRQPERRHEGDERAQLEQLLDRLDWREATDDSWRSRWQTARPGMRRELMSVLLPQQVELLLGPPGDPGHGEDIVVLSMDDGVREDRLGSLLFVSSEKRVELATSKRKALAPSSGTFCLLGDLQLALVSTGVGVLMLDLHPVIAPGGAAGEDDEEGWQEALTGFVADTQYLPGGQRDTKVTAFLSPAPFLLTSDEPALAGAKGDLITAHAQRLAERVTAEAQRQLQAEHTLPPKLAGAIKARSNMLCKGFFGAAGANAPALDGGTRFALTTHLQLPNSGAGKARAKLEAHLERSLAVLKPWPWERSRPGAEQPPPDEGSHEACVARAFEAEGAAFRAGIAGAHPTPRAPARGEAVRGPQRWGYDELVREVFEELGLPGSAEKRGELLLNGDRMFTFTHLGLPASSACTVAQQRALAARLSRRHDTKHAPSGSDGAATAAGLFEPFVTLRYHVSLEGVAAVQAEGGNSEFFAQVQVVRERHFGLVLLALLYRFALLNLSLEGTRERSRDEEVELAHIERLRDRVEHFTHWVYHGHVSNITHLQGLFDLLLERMNVRRLWEDVERDIPQYLERRRTLLEKRAEARREKIEDALKILGAIFVSVQAIDLAEKFGFDLPGWASALDVPWRLALLSGAAVLAGLIAWFWHKRMER